MIERKGTEVPYIETKVIQAPGEELLRQITCPPNVKHGGRVFFMTEDRYPRCPLCGRIPE
jgi:hypothetical protein